MEDATDHIYLIALGSNRRHVAHGHPRSVLKAAVTALKELGLTVQAESKTITTAPVGPSSRRYANNAILVRTQLHPSDLLHLLKNVEAEFGNRRGQRWSSRVLDLDIIWWSGGIFNGINPPLCIPHPAFRTRSFVLAPAAQIAPEIRDPVSSLTLRQLFHRIKSTKPLDRRPNPY